MEELRLVLALTVQEQITKPKKHASALIYSSTGTENDCVSRTVKTLERKMLIMSLQFQLSFARTNTKPIVMFLVRTRLISTWVAATRTLMQ